MTDTITLNRTEAKVIEMLTENTGRHMLDSGGAYGRNWERNQGRDFKAEPAVIMDPTWHNEGDEFRPDVTFNLFHWMTDVLDYDPDMDAAWQAYAEEHRKDEYEWCIMRDFADHLREQGHEVTGLYGSGEPMECNTYNGECLLSQTLQFVWLEIDQTAYMLVQVHGGCDVRGGYTDAVLFEADESALYWTDATIYADGESTFNGDPYWTTDDGYNWYPADGDHKGLHEFTVSHNPAHKGDGEHVYVDEDSKTAYCPLSGLPLIATR